MKRIVLIFFIPFLLTLLYDNAYGQKSISLFKVKLFDGSFSLNKKLVLSFYESQNESENYATEKPTERSFTIANYALAVLSILVASFGFITLIYYFLDRKNQYSAGKFKKDIEVIRKSLEPKTEFNLKAADVTFQSMEYLSYMFLSQNPEIDKDKVFLKEIYENKTILYLYHNNRDARIRALKELQYNGTPSIIDVLKKYRKEVEDNDLSELADKAIDEINKREGAKEALEKEEQNKKKNESSEN